MIYRGYMYIGNGVVVDGYISDNCVVSYIVIGMIVMLRWILIDRVVWLYAGIRDVCSDRVIKDVYDARYWLIKDRSDGSKLMMEDRYVNRYGLIDSSSD